MIKWTDSFEQTKLSFSPQPVPAISSVGGKWGSIFNRTFKPEMFHAAAKLCIYQSPLKHLLKVITVSNEVCRMCAQTWEGFVSPSLPIEITHVCVCLPSCIPSPTPPPAKVTWIIEKQQQKWQQQSHVEVVGRTGVSLPLLDCGVYFQLRSIWTLMPAKLVWTWNPKVSMWVLEECSSDGDDTLWC